MKIAYCSDLHAEFGRLPEFSAVADVLVIAGDLAEVHTLSRTVSSSKYPLAREILDWLEVQCDTFKHVIYVAGNHEFYHGEYQKCLLFLSSFMSYRKNFHFLYNQKVVIEGVSFAGSTLWSYISPQKHWFVKQKMNDYHAIEVKTTSGYRKLRPEDTVLYHSRAVQFLAKNTADVVVTHHAPSYQSVQPEFIGNELNCCYASSVEYLTDGVKLWIHGHMHDKIDYKIGDCNVLCNPRGYAGHEQIARTFQLAVVEI
jgi:Icc-related predicted phosphoesterase